MRSRQHQITRALKGRLRQTELLELRKARLLGIAVDLAMLYWRPESDHQWLRDEKERRRDIAALRRSAGLARIPVRPRQIVAKGMVAVEFMRCSDGDLLDVLSTQTFQELNELADDLELGLRKSKRRRGRPSENRRRDFRLRWEKSAPKHRILGVAVERAIFDTAPPQFPSGGAVKTFGRRLREDRLSF